MWLINLLAQNVRLGQPIPLGPGVNLGPGIEPLGGQAPPELIAIINRLTGYAIGIIIAISVLVIIYAAFLYLTSQGEPSAISRAKHVIIYAFVGIGVAIVAPVLVRIVESIFSGF